MRLFLAAWLFFWAVWPALTGGALLGWLFTMGPSRVDHGSALWAIVVASGLLAHSYPFRNL